MSKYIEYSIEVLLNDKPTKVNTSWFKTFDAPTDISDCTPLSLHDSIDIQKLIDDIGYRSQSEILILWANENLENKIEGFKRLTDDKKNEFEKKIKQLNENEELPDGLKDKISYNLNTCLNFESLKQNLARSKNFNKYIYFLSQINPSKTCEITFEIEKTNIKIEYEKYDQLFDVSSYMVETKYQTPVQLELPKDIVNPWTETKHVLLYQHRTLTHQVIGSLHGRVNDLEKNHYECHVIVDQGIKCFLDGDFWLIFEKNLALFIDRIDESNPDEPIFYGRLKKNILPNRRISGKSFSSLSSQWPNDNIYKNDNDRFLTQAQFQVARENITFFNINDITNKELFQVQTINNQYADVLETNEEEFKKSFLKSAFEKLQENENLDKKNAEEIRNLLYEKISNESSDDQKKITFDSIKNFYGVNGNLQDKSFNDKIQTKIDEWLKTPNIYEGFNSNESNENHGDKILDKIKNSHDIFKIASQIFKSCTITMHKNKIIEAIAVVGLVDDYNKIFPFSFTFPKLIQKINNSIHESKQTTPKDLIITLNIDYSNILIWTKQDKGNNHNETIQKCNEKLHELINQPLIFNHPLFAANYNGFSPLPIGSNHFIAHIKVDPGIPCVYTVTNNNQYIFPSGMKFIIEKIGEIDEKNPIIYGRIIREIIPENTKSFTPFIDYRKFIPQENDCRIDQIFQQSSQYLSEGQKIDENYTQDKSNSSLKLNEEVLLNINENIPALNNVIKNESWNIEDMEKIKELMEIFEKAPKLMKPLNVYVNQALENETDYVQFIMGSLKSSEKYNHIITIKQNVPYLFLFTKDYEILFPPLLKKFIDKNIHGQSSSLRLLSDDFLIK